ncbi:hypothetical protein Fcan01_27430 [Folsomia candida]|uniref:Uncharacterized protein n=1 Tax=Folsomia candida TaxID=158441 RepID=A0A226CWT9_FOLCA|nr:hypothetical protein Fcan01_27430 [Folsomia candida]
MLAHPNFRYTVVHTLAVFYILVIFPVLQFWISCGDQVGAAFTEFVAYQTCCVSASHYVISTTGTSMAALWLDCKELKSGVWYYVNVKVFERQVNSCIRDRIFLALPMNGPLVQVLLGYTLVKIGHTRYAVITLALILLYIVIFTTTMLYFSIAAQVNGMSKEWIAAQKSESRGKEGRKRLRALLPIRVELGRNFVEALTPLLVQGFCMRQTVSLLL